MNVMRTSRAFVKANVKDYGKRSPRNIKRKCQKHGDCPSGQVTIQSRSPLYSIAHNDARTGEPAVWSWSRSTVEEHLEIIIYKSGNGISYLEPGSILVLVLRELGVSSTQLAAGHTHAETNILHLKITLQKMYRYQ